MRESTDRVETALRGASVKENLVAQRILENPKTWTLWEGEHSSLMRQIADTGGLQAQAASLRHTALRLIHGKALFEHLRNQSVRGDERMRILQHFHPTRSFQDAVVVEHGDYFRKACSYICTSHLGAGVVRDAAFLDPMQQYEELYAEYFDLYCRTAFALEEGAATLERSLLPLLKAQLNDWRWAILNPRAAEPLVRRESQIRSATGDTQRLPQLKIHPKAT